MSVSANRRPAGPPVPAARRRTRVLVIVGLVAGAVVASALIGWRFARESPPVSGPILLISIDPLPPSRLRIYGGSSTATPNLDRLAAVATVFTRARSHAAASLPAHASLLTGRLPFEHGIRDDVGFTLAPEFDTLASRLADRGFDTGAAVSSYLLRAETGLGAGFARYDAARPAAADALMPPVERDSAATAEAAVAWLDQQGSERFFYALHLNGGPPAEASPAAADVADPLAAADAAMGAVFDALRRREWFDHALIVVTSTSGAPPAPAGGPGRDFTLDPAALHVPLVVKMPDGAGAQRVEAPMQHIDLTPTVLDLVRAPGDSGLPGRSFRRLLEGDDSTPPGTPPYREAMSGAMRFGWAELADPADAGRAAGKANPPALATPAERDALARLGEVAPTLLPDADATPTGEPLDPRTMGQVLTAYRRGALHDARRQFAAAITAYHEVTRGWPDAADAWRRIGIAAARLSRVDDALAAFTKAAALRAGPDETTLDAAGVEIAAGRLDAAATRLAALLDDGTASRTTQAEAHVQLAEIALARHRPDDARTHAAAADTARPGVPFAAFVDARILLDRGESAAALAGFEAVDRALDGHAAPWAGVHRYRGDALAGLDRHDDALAAYEQAITNAPDDLRAYTSLATLQRASGRRDDAAMAIDRLIRAVPTPAGYATAARLWTVLGDRARAAALRAEARERFAGEPAARATTR